MRGSLSRMEKLKSKAYRALVEPLEIELVEMARWAAVTGARIVVVFEGRDTAGKGGAIGAISGPLNARQCRTVALTKPSDREVGNGISSAMSRICPARVKSCCSIAAGTTAPGWKR